MKNIIFALNIFYNICLLFKSLTMKVFVNLNFKIHHKFSKRLVFSICSVFSPFQIIYKYKKGCFMQQLCSSKALPFRLFIIVFFGYKHFYVHSTKYYGDYNIFCLILFSEF